MSLGLELRRRQNEMLWDNGELVQYDIVRRAHIHNAESRGRVCERVEWLEGFGVILRRRLGFVCQCWREAKLELQKLSAAVSSSIPTSRECRGEQRSLAGTHWDIVGLEDGDLGGVVVQIAFRASLCKRRLDQVWEGRGSLETSHYEALFRYFQCQGI